jgi:hypothetical protein
MSVSAGKLEFIADSGDHSMSFDRSEAKELRVLGGGPGRFQIKASGKQQTFRVLTQTRDEADVLERVVSRFFTSTGNSK